MPTRNTSPGWLGQLALQVMAACLPCSALLASDIVVTSEPAGAEVRLDGRRVGRTPASVRDATPGKHRVRVELSGYLAFAQAVSATDTGTASVHARLVPSGRPPDPAKAAAAQPPAADGCTARVVLVRGSELRVVARPVAVIPELVRIGDFVATSTDPALTVLRNDRASLIFKERDRDSLLAVPVAGRETLTTLEDVDSQSITGTLSGAPRPPRIPLAALDRIERRVADRWVGLTLGPARGPKSSLRLTGVARLSPTPVEPFEAVVLRPSARVKIAARATTSAMGQTSAPVLCGPPSPLGLSVTQRGEGRPALACPGQGTPVEGTLLDLTDSHWLVQRDEAGDVVEVPRQPDLSARTVCDGDWLPVADDARFEGASAGAR